MKERLYDKLCVTFYGHTPVRHFFFVYYFSWIEKRVTSYLNLVRIMCNNYALLHMYQYQEQFQLVTVECRQ